MFDQAQALKESVDEEKGDRDKARKMEKTTVSGTHVSANLW